MSKADIFDEYFDNGKRYIIKNCPSCYYIYCDKEYECNWRGSGITKPCKDCTDCLLKQIVEKLRILENKSAELSFCEFKQYVDEVYIQDMFNELLDIQEVE